MEDTGLFPISIDAALPIFNAEFYAANLELAGIVLVDQDGDGDVDNDDAFLDYLNEGFAAGRIASPIQARTFRDLDGDGTLEELSAFDNDFYLASNPDVQDLIDAGLVSSALEHYILIGAAQDTVNSDNADTGGAPGSEEQFDPNPFFDTAAYLNANEDVADAGINPYFHFLQFGEAEVIAGTRPQTGITGLDLQVYAAENPDVAAIVETGALTFFQHFLQFGRFENRPGVTLSELPDPTPAPASLISDVEAGEDGVAAVALSTADGTIGLNPEGDTNGDGQITIAGRADDLDALRITGNADVRVDLTTSGEQVESVDLDGDGVFDAGVETNSRGLFEVSDFEVVDAYARNPLQPTDSANNFTGSLLFDGTGVGGEGSILTDGNIVLGGTGDDVIRGGIGNDYLVGGGGTDTLEGGRNADFFYVDVTSLDAGFSNQGSNIEGGETSDDTIGTSNNGPQDRDWLLWEASDDEEPSNIDLETTVGFGNQIENFDASGNQYGFLEVKDASGDSLLSGVALGDLRDAPADFLARFDTDGDGAFGAGDAAIPFSVGSTAQLDVDGGASDNIIIGGYDNDTINGDGGNDLIFGGRIDFLLANANNPNLLTSDLKLNVNTEAGDQISDDGTDDIGGDEGDDNIVADFGGGDRVSGDSDNDEGSVEGDAAADDGLVIRDNGAITLGMMTLLGGKADLQADGSDGDSFWVTDFSFSYDIGAQAGPNATTATADGTILTDNVLRLDLANSGGDLFRGYGGIDDAGTTIDRSQLNTSTGGVRRGDIEDFENIILSGIGAIDFNALGASSDSEFIQEFQLFDGLGAQADAQLFGNGEANVLYADGGNDRLEGRAGDDALSGRGGIDDFVFTVGDENDVIHRQDVKALPEGGLIFAGTFSKDFGQDDITTVGASQISFQFTNPGAEFVGGFDDIVDITQLTFKLDVDGDGAFGADEFFVAFIDTPQESLGGLAAEFNSQVTIEGVSVTAASNSIVIADEQGRTFGQASIAGDVTGDELDVLALDQDAVADTTGDRLVFVSYDTREINDRRADAAALDLNGNDFTFSLGEDGILARGVGQSFRVVYDDVQIGSQLTVTINDQSFNVLITGEESASDFEIAEDLNEAVNDLVAQINGIDEGGLIGGTVATAVNSDGVGGVDTITLTENLLGGVSGLTLEVTSSVAGIGDTVVINDGDLSTTLVGYQFRRDGLTEEQAIFVGEGNGDLVFTTEESGSSIIILKSDAGNVDITGKDDTAGAAVADGDDLLVGSDGNNIINGLGGDDVIYGSLGNDTVDGGAGADTFILNELLFGEAGGGTTFFIELNLDGTADVTARDAAGTTIGSVTLTNVEQIRTLSDTADDTLDLQAQSDAIVANRAGDNVIGPDDFFDVSPDALFPLDPLDPLSPLVPGNNNAPPFLGNDDGFEFEGLNIVLSGANPTISFDQDFNDDDELDFDEDLPGLDDLDNLLTAVIGVENLITGLGNDRVVLDESQATSSNKLELGGEVDGDPLDDDGRAENGDLVVFDHSALAAADRPIITIQVESGLETDTVSLSGAASDTLVDVEFLDVNLAATGSANADTIDLSFISGAAVNFANALTLADNLGAQGLNIADDRSGDGLEVDVTEGSITNPETVDQEDGNVLAVGGVSDLEVGALGIEFLEIFGIEDIEVVIGSSAKDVVFFGNTAPGGAYTFDLLGGVDTVDFREEGRRAAASSALFEVLGNTVNEADLQVNVEFDNVGDGFVSNGGSDLDGDDRGVPDEADLNEVETVAPDDGAPDQTVNLADVEWVVGVADFNDGDAIEYKNIIDVRDLNEDVTITYGEKSFADLLGEADDTATSFSSVLVALDSDNTALVRFLEEGERTVEFDVIEGSEANETVNFTDGQGDRADTLNLREGDNTVSYAALTTSDTGSEGPVRANVDFFDKGDQDEDLDVDLSVKVTSQSFADGDVAAFDTITTDEGTLKIIGTSSQDDLLSVVGTVDSGGANPFAEGVVINLNDGALQTPEDTVLEAGGVIDSFDDTNVDGDRDVGEPAAKLDIQQTVLTVSDFENFTGTAENDIIIGSGGNNALTGGAGDDEITGGAGSDTLTGGAGADIFFYTGFADGNEIDDVEVDTASADTIVDFAAGIDQIGIAGSLQQVLEGNGFVQTGVAGSFSAAEAGVFISQTALTVDLDDQGSIAGALNTAFGAIDTLADDDQLILGVVDKDGDFALYAFKNNGVNDAAIDAGDAISLLVDVDGTTPTSADFVTVVESQAGDEEFDLTATDGDAIFVYDTLTDSKRGSADIITGFDGQNDLIDLSDLGLFDTLGEAEDSDLLQDGDEDGQREDGETLDGVLTAAEVIRSAPNRTSVTDFDQADFFQTDADGDGTFDGDAVVVIEQEGNETDFRIFVDLNRDGDFDTDDDLVIDLNNAILQDEGVEIDFGDGVVFQSETFVGFDLVITGDAAGNIITGTVGNDLIQGLAGNDVILGDTGDDTIEGGAGDDLLDGEGGNDVIFGGAGNDIIDDTVDGDDLLDGGAGLDTITAGTGSDVVRPGGGADIVDLTADGESDVVEFLFNTDSNALLQNLTTIANFEAANDTINLAAFNLTDRGFDATQAAVAAVDGQALLATVNLFDSIIGGANGDLVIVDTNNNGVFDIESDLAFEVDGGAALTAANFDADGDGTGSDLVGAVGFVFDAPSIDNDLQVFEDVTVVPATIDLLGGTDTLVASPLSITGISVDLSDDTAFADTVDGAATSVENVENLTGSAQVDALTGSTGANVLRGLGGADTIIGNDGADTIEGGAGQDILTGDDLAGTVTGADTFVFNLGDSAGGAADTITDFQSGTDVIDLSALELALDTVAGAPFGLPSDQLRLNNTDTNTGAASAAGDFSLAAAAGDNIIDVFVDINGADTTIIIDIDDNGVIDATDDQIILTGVTSVSSLDFIF